MAGANYGWPNVEGTSSNPAYTNPIYSYAHNGRDAAITGGFVYHGTQFPSSYQGSYFFADYAQNWIKRLTFDANGNVNGVFNFEPANGAADGPYGDIVYLTEGPDGALYYVDLGYSDTTGTLGVSKIRRISYVNSQPAAGGFCFCDTDAKARPRSPSLSPAPAHPIPKASRSAYSWNFGDGSNFHRGQPDAHLHCCRTVSGPAHGFGRREFHDLDTVEHQRRKSTGYRNPCHHQFHPASTAGLFRAGDVISFSATATDARWHRCRASRLHLEHRLPARRPRTPGHSRLPA